MRNSAARSKSRLGLLATATGVWLVSGAEAPWTWLLAWCAAWAAFNYLEWNILTRPVFGAVVFCVGLVRLSGSSPPWWEDVGALPERLQDRQRWRSDIAVAPYTVMGGARQTMWIHAPRRDTVAMSWTVAGGDARITPLGDGLFRADVRAPHWERTAEVQVELTSNRETVRRTLWGARALPHPRSPVLGPGGWAAAVSEETGELILFDARGGWQVLAVGGEPSAVAWWDTEHVAVLQRAEGTLQVWPLDAKAPRWTVPVGSEPSHLVVGEHAVVVTGDAMVTVAREGEPRAVDRSSPPPGVVDAVMFGGAEYELIIAERRGARLLRYQRHEAANAGAWQLAGELRLGRPATALVASPQGPWVAVTAYHPEPGPQPGNHFVQDQLLRVDLAQWRVVEQRLTGRRAARAERGDHTLAYQRGASPLGLAVDPQGRLWTSFAGTDEVWRWEEPAPRAMIFGDEGVVAPEGLVVFGERWAVVSPSLGAVSIYEDDRLVARHAMHPSAEELASHDPESSARQRGERAFYEATRSGRACQSCHLRGDSDLANHDINEGERMPSTLSVRGVAGTSPYLRGGSYPRLRDLHALNEGVFGGFMREEPERAVLLERFIQGLALPPAPSPGPLAQSGWVVFQRAGCVECHPPPAFTDLALHREALLFPSMQSDAWWDTPSLLRVSSSAPYLFDGRAASLHDVLELSAAEGDGHGRVSELSPSDRAALVAFLEQL